MPQLHTRKASNKDVPTQVRAAALVPSTFNEAENTVDVVFSAGARVARRDWSTGQRYEEQLEVSAAAIDLTRVEAGVVQVLDNHDMYSGVRSVLGVVVRAWVEGDEARATLRLSSDPAKAGTVADIKAGVLRAISVGYSVQRYLVDDEPEDGAMPLWTATRWMPQELSFVSVPADPGASTRSAGEPGAPRTEPCEFITRGKAASISKDTSMPPEDNQGAGQPAGAATQTAAAPAAAPAVAAAPAAARGADDLTQRAADISDLCTRHAVPHMAAQLIRAGADLPAAKDAILNAIAVRDAASGGQQNARIVTVNDETETRIRGMEDALFSRLDPAFKLTDNGRQFRHLTLVEMGREHLERSGVSTRGMDKMNIARQMLQVRAAGMHSTSDFGALFTNVASRRLSAVYSAFPATYTVWARRGPNLSDFKPVQVVSMGAGPELLKVNEHGEFKYGTFGDGSETYQLATYGRIVAMTRQAIINDDLRGFDRLIGMFGSSAKRLENTLVYAQLAGNPLMSDGKALFHADHNNLLTGAGSALSLDGLTAGRAKMRKQTGQAGESLNLAPKYLIVPSALETLAYQLTSNAYVPTSQAGINEFAAGGRSALTVVVDPELDKTSATAWYLAAENAVVDTVEFAYLDGADGPVTETREGFEVDGTEIKARLDFAAKALEYRGLVKANGA
jgi:hypothetical protein